MDLLLLATFIVALLSSIISGMSGGGGGFIMTPYFLAIGFTPQQIVGGASVAALGLGGSSLWAMRGHSLIQGRFLKPLAVLTTIMTIAAISVLPRIQSESFELVIGILLIFLAPTLFINKASLQPGNRSKKSLTFGYITYGAILFASALGSGLATLLFLPLMFLMGLTALEANATRRALSLLQSIIMFILILPMGVIVWGHALACLVGCIIGGHIGTKFALKKGNNFVKLTLAIVMVLSGIGLLLIK